MEARGVNDTIRLGVRQPKRGKRKNNFRRQTLIEMIEGIRDILENEECDSRWVPFRTVADEYRRTVPKSGSIQELKLDRRGYRGKKTV